jgi:hypothetical protein
MIVVFFVRLWDCGILCSSMGLWYSLFIYVLVVFFVRLCACDILRSAMGLWYCYSVYGRGVFFVRLWACGILCSSMGLWYSSFKTNEEYHKPIDEQRIPQAHRRTKNTSLSMGLWYSSFVYGLVVFFVRLWACGILRSSMDMWYIFVRLWACGISSFEYGPIDERRIPQAHRQTKNTTSP